MSPARAIAAALVAALLLVPVGQAYHYSVGSQDAVGVDPEETPGDPDTSPALYERGTSTDCKEPSREIEDAPQAAAASRERDPFCGRLVYHEGTTFEQEAPPDQDHLREGWTFDVVATQYVGTYGLDTCYPWCAPGGVTALDAVEDTLQQLAPSVFAGDHEDEEDPGHQSYAVDVRFQAAGSVLNEEAGLGEGSGWMLPTTDPTFVGFLSDDEGSPVDDQRLRSLVTSLAGDELPSDAVPLVCGFSPDFTGGGPTEDAPLTDSVASRCDVLFTWRSDEPDASFGPEANDRCASATYVCGTLQPAWYGQLACSGWAGCQPAHQAGDAWHSTTDHDVWHFVAAPAPSDCNGDRQPGFQTSVETTGRQGAYLAHDLDVYTPPTSEASEAGPGELPEAWTGQLLPPAVNDVDRGRLDPAKEGHRTMEAQDAPASVKAAYGTVYKPPIPEPNAAGDTSQSIELDRTLAPCQGIGGAAESVVDPWVNQIDTRQRYWTWNGMHANMVEPYANARTDQDQNNRPGPGFYLSDGKVGMFTDRDDDGRYDQATPEALFTDIQRVGAYPMFYDMRLDEQLNPSGGCPTSFAQQPIAEAMADAGYGPRTGLVEAVYLAEPTTLLDRRTGETYPFPGGDHVFVAKTQAVKVLEAAGDATVRDVIQSTIDATGAPASADVVELDDVVPQASDFWEQCGEPTGRYVQEMMFLHDCTVDCSGDTVATTYLFEVTSDDGTLGGGAIPTFQPDGESAHSFGKGVHVWTDVDPFDGDPDRNTRDGTPEH